MNPVAVVKPLAKRCELICKNISTSLAFASAGTDFECLNNVQNPPVPLQDRIGQVETVVFPSRNDYKPSLSPAPSQGCLKAAAKYRR